MGLRGLADASHEATRVRAIKLSEQIVGRIGSRLAAQPGMDSDLSETQVCQEFGVSRTVAREVLQTLASIGMVKVSHGRRSRILPPSEWDHLSPVVLRFYGDAREVRTVMAELHDVRLILEPEIAARAAELAAPHHLAELRTCLETMARSLREPSVYMEADLAFHDVLVKASENRVLNRIMELNQSLLHSSRQITNEIPHGLVEASLAHRRVYEAVAAGDSDRARLEMYEHICFAARAWKSQPPAGER